MSAIKKFNRNYLQHAQNRGKLLTELSYFLNWTSDQFEISNLSTSTIADNLDTITFFRNLNEQLMISEPNHDFFWNAFQIIYISMQNTTTRRFLIDSLRIITGISNFAIKVAPYETEEKQIQVWKLLENITTGINIPSEEPYLTDLIEHLVTSIKDQQLSEEIKLLQTSILTNLCFNNEVSVACLLRFTKSKELLNAIHDIRILWCKMAFAIARFDNEMLDFELITIFKSVFDVEYFSGLIRTKNQRLLKHVLELLEKCLQGDEHSINTSQQFDFNETIDGILAIFDSQMQLEEDNDDEKENSERMDLFLGIINLILTATNTSLQSNLHRLFKLAIEQVGTVTISSTAIKTVRLIISNFEMVKSPELITLISRLLENIDHSNLPVASEVYRLLSTMYTKCRNVINKLSEDRIHKLIDVRNLCFKLTDDNLCMLIHRLQWLFIYTSQNETFIPELEHIMQNKNVHNILANGLTHSSQDICSLTMSLIQSKHFPLQAVSKILANANSPPTRSNCSCSSKSTIEITRPCFSAALEKRVNVAVDQVMENMKDDSPKRKSEHIGILEYQNIFASSKINLLESQLKTTSEMITAQSNEIGGLNIIIRQCRNKLSQMEMKEKHYGETVEKMKIGYNSLKAKYNNITIQLTDLSKKNEDLKQERTNLKRDLKQRENDNSDLKDQLAAERKTHLAIVTQERDNHDREKSELKSQHAKELESLSNKLIQDTQKQTEELKLQYTKDLEDYSKKQAKLSKQVKAYEQKIQDNKTELENCSTKVNQLKNELAEYVRSNEKYKKDIDEKEIELTATKAKLNDSEQRLEMITNLLKPK